MVELDCKATSGDVNLSEITMEDEEATGRIKRSQTNPALHYTLRKGEHLRSSHRSQGFSSRDGTGAFGMCGRMWEVFWFSQ